MQRDLSRFVMILAACFGMGACAKDAEDERPKGPVSDTSVIPWNAPVAGQGQGSMGMLPQNQYRR